jgi:hypothetical protein
MFKTCEKRSLTRSLLCTTGYVPPVDGSDHFLPERLGSGVSTTHLVCGTRIGTSFIYEVVASDESSGHHWHTTIPDTVLSNVLHRLSCGPTTLRRGRHDQSGVLPCPLILLTLRLRLDSNFQKISDALRLNFCTEVFFRVALLCVCSFGLSRT